MKDKQVCKLGRELGDLQDKEKDIEREIHKIKKRISSKTKKWADKASLQIELEANKNQLKTTRQARKFKQKEYISKLQDRIIELIREHNLTTSYDLYDTIFIGDRPKNDDYFWRILNSLTDANILIETEDSDQFHYQYNINTTEHKTPKSIIRQFAISKKDNPKVPIYTLIEVWSMLNNRPTGLVYERFRSYEKAVNFAEKHGDLIYSDGE